MVINIFKILGALGLILIILGVLTKKRKSQDFFYILGGLCLLIYSIYLMDIIFIILQYVFSLVAFYDLIKLQKHKTK